MRNISNKVQEPKSDHVTDKAFKVNERKLTLKHRYLCKIEF